MLGWGRFPGVGNGNLIQYSCLENSMDRGIWWATAHGGHKESDMTERLSIAHSTYLRGNQGVMNRDLYKIITMGMTGN